MKMTPEVRRLVARPFATRAEAIMAAQLAADLRGLSVFVRETSPGCWRLRWSAAFYSSTEVRVLPQRVTRKT
jgi:hypothetical protein